MVYLNAYDSDGVDYTQDLKWLIKSLETNSIVIEVQLLNLSKVSLSDYFEVKLDFSSFDKNWQYYTTGLKQSEIGRVKVVAVSLKDLNDGDSKLFRFLREASRIIQLFALAYFCLCAFLKLFTGLSVFNSHLFLTSIQMFVHIPLLNLELPKLTGEVLRPLIAIAKCDLTSIVTKKKAYTYVKQLIAPEFIYLSGQQPSMAYLHYLYKSSILPHSIKVILVLIAISIGAILMLAPFHFFRRVKVLEWVYRRCLLRTFVFSFPLRLLIQMWMFFIIACLLNFMLFKETEKDSWYQLSWVVSVIISILLVANQICWFVIGSLCEKQMKKVLDNHQFYCIFGTLYDGLQIKRAAFFYNAIQLMKKTLFVISLFVISKVWYQLMLNCLVSMIYLIFITIAKPHDTMFNRVLEISQELTFLVLIYSGFSIANNDYTTNEYFYLSQSQFGSYKQIEIAGYVIISGMLFSIALQSFANWIKTFHTCYKALKTYIYRGKFRT